MFFLFYSVVKLFKYFCTIIVYIINLLNLGGKNECSELADLIACVTGYTKEKSDSEYSEVVPGGFKDWASSKPNNPIPSITIEVGLGTCPLKISEFKYIWNANYKVLAAIAYMLKLY